MYDKSDPRASLQTAAPSAQIDAPFFGMDYAKFYESEPQEISEHARNWYVRGQNFLVGYSLAKSGAMLARERQDDEYVVVLPDRSTRLKITAGAEIVDIAGFSLTIVPPGPSTIEVLSGGAVVRLLTSAAEDLLSLCANNGTYARPHARVAPLTRWPAPPDGFRVRTYSLDVPVEGRRYGRIWRCTTFMVNYALPREGQRDITTLSPHHHDDFEQGSLAVTGEFLHHVRWPWVTNKTYWREDEHAYCASPSVAIIPPPAVHTTEATGPSTNQLVDIFCPPRLDFASKAGWVMNENEYPMP